MRRAAVLSAVLLLAAVLPVAAAPPQHDPDWPCQQIKVPDLSAASVWNGPPVDAYATSWSQDPAVTDLVSRLAQRRLPIDQAKTEIDGFAVNAGVSRRQKLLAVFAGLFDTLNRERGNVLVGLDRYGRRQKELADTVRGEVDALHKQQDSDKPDAQQVSALTERLGWDTRVFEQRRQSVSFACDVPNVIEQRLYALAQALQQAVGS